MTRPGTYSETTGNTTTEQASILLFRLAKKLGAGQLEKLQIIKNAPDTFRNTVVAPQRSSHLRQ